MDVAKPEVLDQLPFVQLRPNNSNHHHHQNHRVNSTLPFRNSSSINHNSSNVVSSAPIGSSESGGGTVSPSAAPPNNSGGTATAGGDTSNNSSNNNNNLDRLSNVSLLARQYLLFENSPNSTNKSSSLVKSYQRCIKIESKEQFSCKVVPRNQEGLQLIAAYHRLEEGCDAISKVHEVILSPKSFYLIMPPTYGTVHAYLLARKKLKEPEAANIFRQMVTAVKFCHEKGIVLRDLKMGKFVFHDKERTIVRLDTLEDAVLLNDLNDDGLSDKHGCPNYVSPEKAEILRSNKKYPGKATDMWGLGVILYTLLVGRYPFNDEDHSKLFVKIRRGQYTLPDSLSGPAKFLIRFLLQKDPSARPTCGEILKYSWLNPGAHQQQPSNSSRASIPPASVVISTPNPHTTASRLAVASGASTLLPTVQSSSISISSTTTTNNISNMMVESGTSELTTTMFDNYNKDTRPKSYDGEDQVVPNIDMD